MKKLPGLLLLLGIAAAVTLFVVQRDRIPEIAAWFQERGLGGAVSVGLVYAAATVLMVPASVITLGVGFVYGPWIGTLIVSPASVLGATAAFLLGRTLLRGPVQARMEDNARFQALQGALARRGLRILVLTRLSPVFPFTLLNYAFGITPLSLRHYVVGSWLAMLPGTLMYVYLGSTLDDISQILSGAPDGGTAQQLLKWGGLAATVIVTVYITRLAKRTLSEEAPSVVGGGAAPEEPA